MNDNTNAPPLPPNLTPGQSAQIEHGRRLFEVCMRSSRDLIAKGCPPGAIVSGLLGVAVAIGNEAAGARAMRRILMQAADANSDDDGAAG